jgi:hypothetical protein
VEGQQLAGAGCRHRVSLVVLRQLQSLSQLACLLVSRHGLFTVQLAETSQHLRCCQSLVHCVVLCCAV